MYLIDTNIFLEILLSQKQKDICKEFLVSNTEHIYISDFSLHSIGVILFRNNKETVFPALCFLCERVRPVIFPPLIIGICFPFSNRHRREEKG
jgi:predicted nucleic acid-binding protein